MSPLNEELKSAHKLHLQAKASLDANNKLIQKFAKLVRVIVQKEFSSSGRGGVRVNENYAVNNFCNELLEEVGYYKPETIKQKGYDSKGGGTLSGM